MINKRQTWLAIGLYLITLPAFTIDLQTAKNQKLIGEVPSGYIAAVNAPSKEVQNLVNSINAKRKVHYKKIAKANGADLRAVEQLAGKKAINKTKKNQYVKINGQWRLK